MANLIDEARARLSLPNLADIETSLLRRLVTAASDRIKLEIGGRDIVSTTYTEIRNSCGEQVLQLRQYPVTAISRIATDRTAAITIKNTDDSTNQRATVAVTSTGLTLVRVASGTTSTDTSVTWASNSTVSAVETAVDALGNGWSATASSDYSSWPSSELFATQGAHNALDTDAELEVYSSELSEYQLDADSGIVYGSFPAGVQTIRIDYTAGYSTVPQVLQDATALLVGELYQASTASGGNGRIASKSLGNRSVTYDTSTNDGLPDVVLRLIKPYCDYRYARA